LLYYSQNQIEALKGLLGQYIPVNTAVIADHFSHDFHCPRLSHYMMIYMLLFLSVSM